jgi:hypothetical protein
MWIILDISCIVGGATKINDIDFLYTRWENQKKTSRRVCQTQQKEKDDDRFGF